MKALVYDPYVDTMGGGERYVLTFSLALIKAGYRVTLAWKDGAVIADAAKRFNLDISSLKIAPQAYHDLSLSAGLLARYFRTRDYDLVFWVSDGSLPYLFGKKNYLHFQVPFKKIGGNPINNLLKTVRINRFIFNSAFTANVINGQLPLISSTILFPPIDTESFKSEKKENVILSVARFDSPSHAKRQDILIRCFERVYKKNKDYKLILAGAVKGEGGKDYLSVLQKAAEKLPVQLVSNPDFNELKKLYAKAKIFWHAAGYGVDEKMEPEKVEHFGITTVEAMAAGCVPVVINKGGQREIIVTDKGYLCGSVEEIASTTLSLINSPEKLKLMSGKAVERSKYFLVTVFEAKGHAIIF